MTNLVINGRKEMFYLTTYSTHFIYGYLASEGFFDMHHLTEGSIRQPRGPWGRCTTELMEEVHKGKLVI